MQLSVIIPCLNAEATIAYQLEALASQQWSQPWELIVADNGSSDKSLEIASQYKDRFTSLRIINAPARKSASHPRNAGARVASAENLAFCDADDEVASGWVSLMGEALADHDVVHGQFRFDKFNDVSWAKKAAQEWKDGLYTGRFLPGGGTGNLGIKQRVHEAIGGFDEDLPRFEDADYFWRLQLEGFNLHYVPQAIVQVRMARVNPTSSTMYRRHRTGAAANYWLYKRYRHAGMLPPPPLKNSIETWLHILRNFASATLKNKTNRVAWQNRLAEQTGDLVGQLQGRIANPCKPYQPGVKFRDRKNRCEIGNRKCLF